MLRSNSSGYEQLATAVLTCASDLWSASAFKASNSFEMLRAPHNKLIIRIELIKDGTRREDELRKNSTR